MSKEEKQASFQHLSSHIQRLPTSYNRDVFFFCVKATGFEKRSKLLAAHLLGTHVNDAIEISGNDKLRVKPSTAVEFERCPCN